MGKYLNEAGLAHLWTQIKENFAKGGGGSSENSGDADYYAHWNYRVQQLTADLPTITVPETVGEHAREEYQRRPITMLDINGNADDFNKTEVIIMHPKSRGEFDFRFWDVCDCHILVAKGVTSIKFVDSGAIVDLTLFTGDTPFPTLSHDAYEMKVFVQKGRKAELEKMTNWSSCFIEEVETW